MPRQLQGNIQKGSAWRTCNGIGGDLPVFEQCPTDKPLVFLCAQHRIFTGGGGRTLTGFCFCGICGDDA